MRWLPVRSLLIFTSLYVACVATEPDTTEPLRSEPAPAAAAVEAEPNPVQQQEGAAYFFAVVGQTGVEHCPAGEYPATWLDVQTTLGWIPTSGVADALFEPLMDLPVLARGRAGAAPERPPLDVQPQPCPIMQMRSDWVTTPRGIRSRRTSPPDMAHFHASSVRHLDELAVTLEGDQVLVTFTNPLPFALAQVRIELHYEGCYGKPGATTRASEPRTLAPGQTLTERFWVIAEHDQAGGSSNGRQHLAAALVLELGAQDVPADAAVYADLAVGLHALGLDLRCPKR